HIQTLDLADISNNASGVTRRRCHLPLRSPSVAFYYLSRSASHWRSSSPTTLPIVRNSGCDATFSTFSPRRVGSIISRNTGCSPRACWGSAPPWSTLLF
ncbi:MAG: hypothetical protein ACO204_07960, partial [Schleiferiaceae bacterium]